MELALAQSNKLWCNFKQWAVKVFNAFIEARQKEANRRIAMMHLYRMNDRELNDIGIGRGDIRRVVYED